MRIVLTGLIQEVDLLRIVGTSSQQESVNSELPFFTLRAKYTVQNIEFSDIGKKVLRDLASAKPFSLVILLKLINSPGWGNCAVGILPEWCPGES